MVILMSRPKERNESSALRSTTLKSGSLRRFRNIIPSPLLMVQKIKGREMHYLATVESGSNIWLEIEVSPRRYGTSLVDHLQLLV